MDTKIREYEITPLQEVRESFIRELDQNKNKREYINSHADSLFDVGLTMYSSNFSFNSAVYNAFSLSMLDDGISLHPEQLRVLSKIKDNKGLVLSAPTSFGKTFILFEYIAREYPKNIVFVVPTLALVDEYKRRIINQYRKKFERYKVYLSIDEEKSYDLKGYNIFLVTHDRVIDEKIHEIIPNIDFLVIDEVYKLQKNENDDRVLILNLAYYNLASISNKYVLLAPFISGVKNIDKLDSKPAFYSTNYSAVVNEVNEIPVSSEKERLCSTKELIHKINGNTLIYFPTVTELNKYISSLKDDDIDASYTNKTLKSFISWAKKEIHEKWSVIKAMEHGYLVHHGQLPLGIRMLELDLFNEDESNNYHGMLCTSTLLEGVNTSAKNIIITKPARNSAEFDAFDFFNLVGRTGRLFHYYLGTAYYIKGPKDKTYVKNEALKSIEFELTSNSIDIDINNGQYDNYPLFNDFLKKLKIDYDSYRKEIGAKCRFNTVYSLYARYLSNRDDLFNILEIQCNEARVSKLEMVRALYKITNDSDKNCNIDSFLINRLTYKNANSYTIKQIINETQKYYKKYTIDYVIKRALYLKNSFIEFDFYKKIHLIQFFMKCENQDSSLIEIINKKLMNNIEKIYYVNAPSRKILKDMGIYYRDIERVEKVIGTNFNSVEELRILLQQHFKEIKKISVISKYVISKFCEIDG